MLKPRFLGRTCLIKVKKLFKNTKKKVKYDNSDQFHTKNKQNRVVCELTDLQQEAEGKKVKINMKISTGATISINS